MKQFQQRTSSSQKEIENWIEIIGDKTTEDTVEYLSKWNQVGSLHAEFIKQLAYCYAEQLIGDQPRRTIWPAHPGLGKTTCLRFFLLNVIKIIRGKSMPERLMRDILVCSNQVLELEDHLLFLQQQLGDEVLEIGLYHTKQDGNGFRRRLPVIREADIQEYPIIFATQNLIRKRGEMVHRDRSTQNLSSFGHVTHTVNGVRLLCWDEEAIATKANHVNIEALIEFRRRHEESGIKSLDLYVTSLVDPVLAQIKERQAEPGLDSAFNIHVPKLEYWQLQDAKGILNSTRASSEYGDNYLRQARQLSSWQGDSAAIHFTTNTANSQKTGIVMDYVIEVPPELDRAVITDASAAINKLIRLDHNLKQSLFMTHHGQDLKRYDNVRLYIQALPSGRSSFLEGDKISTEWKMLLMDIVPKIRRLSPPGPSLIITFKGSRASDQHIEEIRSLLYAEDQEQLYFTTYGKHRGDNQWSHCTSVILAGTFHRDERELSSLARSQTRKPLDDHAQPYTTKELVHSQTASDIQQALARGVCREVMTVAGVTQAKPMNAFMGLSKRELPHVVGHLRECFPGIQVYDLATGDKLSEEDMLSTKAKVERLLINYLSVCTDKQVKSSVIRSMIEEILGQTIKATLWSNAQASTNISGWVKDGHSWIRQY